jgi:dTDP-4-dehydrorhamnose 3,5-epimerase
MKVTKTAIAQCMLIEPKVFGDDRGFFLETFQAERYQQLAGIELPFVQDNHSRSAQGVLRGLHFQKTKPQGKLVRVIQGEVFDVAVDLRKDSPSFGQWFGVHLSEQNHRQLWLPPGLAHGFLVLSESADFEYKCTDYYDPSDEGILRYDDATVGVQWPAMPQYLLSAKDQAGKSFQEIVDETANHWR